MKQIYNCVLFTQNENILRRSMNIRCAYRNTKRLYKNAEFFIFVFDAIERLVKFQIKRGNISV